MKKLNYQNLSIKYSELKLRTLLWFLKFSCQNNLLPTILVNSLLFLLKPRSHWKLVPLVWLDNLEGYEKHILRIGGPCTSYAPHFLNSNTFKTSHVTPDINYYAISNGQVSATSSSVILDSQMIAVERVQNIDEKLGNYSSGQLVCNGTNRAVVKQGHSEKISHGIFFGGNGSFNYYHWMVEILSKSEFLNQLPHGYLEYPILIHQNVLSTPSLKQTFEMFLLDRQVIPLDPERLYSVAKLIMIDSPNNLPFNVHGNSSFKCSYSQIDDRSIKYLRDKVLDSVLPPTATETYPKKIFFCSRAERRAYNKYEILGILKKYGFEPVIFEELSFAEQVKTIHHADYLAGPTGAVWTNLIFAKPGCKGLCWMAEEFGNFAAYSTIAKSVGVELRYITYKTGVDSTIRLYRKSYELDATLVTTVLEAFTLANSNKPAAHSGPFSL